MNTKEVVYSFWNTIQDNFPDVRMKAPTENRPNRFSLYVPNQKRNKRWLQVDWNVNVVILLWII